MVTLQNHVSSILAKSARIAAEEVIKLFDSSFEAFIEELRKRQEEIDSLKRKLEVAETELSNEVDPGATTYLCGQCGINLNSMIQLENHKTDDTDNRSAQDLDTDVNDQALEIAPFEQSDTEECIEFEVPSEEDDSYSHLIQKNESTDHRHTVDQEELLRKEKSTSDKVIPQKRGRGRPRKHQTESVCEVLKRGRGRPRKAVVSVTLQSSKTFSSQEQFTKEQMKKESVTELPSVQLNHTQDTLCHTVSKNESQSTSIVRQKNRRGRPRNILNSLFLPFGKAKSILHGQENQIRRPDPLKNEPEDKPESKTEEDIPLENSLKVQKRRASWIVCPKCPRKFPSKTKLQAHAKFHLKKGELKCRICGMTFIGQSQMSNHEKVHTGEKPFSCNFCPRRYPNLSQFKKHLLSHAAPDYACEVCGLRASHVSRETFRKAHLRNKEPCTNCALIYT